ncbi:MAG: hypothetical protein FWG64_01315 [Firmicutes bacterium]|nr:hypothetical protein [Bacillota bacterium]
MKFMKVLTSVLMLIVMGITPIFAAEPHERLVTWAMLEPHGTRNQNITLITYTYQQTSENSEPVLVNRSEINTTGITFSGSLGFDLEGNPMPTDNPLFNMAVPLNSLDFVQNITFWPGDETSLNRAMRTPAVGFVIRDVVDDGWWLVRSRADDPLSRYSTRGPYWSVTGFFEDFEETQSILNNYLGHPTVWSWRAGGAPSILNWGASARDVRRSGRAMGASIQTPERRELERTATDRSAANARRFNPVSALRIEDTRIVDGVTMAHIQFLQSLPTVDRIEFDVDARTITIHRIE